MTLDEIRTLTIKDFENHNAEVWRAIESLNIFQLEVLEKVSKTAWNDEDIFQGISDVLCEKRVEYLEKQIKELYKNNKQAFEFLIEQGAELRDFTSLVKRT